MAKKEFQLGDTPVEVNSEWFECEGEFCFQTLINLKKANGGQIDLGSCRVSNSDLADYISDAKESGTSWGMDIAIDGEATQSQLKEVAEFIRETYDKSRPRRNPGLLELSM